MLEARHLVKRYGGARVVDDVSFIVRPSEVLGYLGPNGSGKTTTVNMLTGLVEPSQGQVLFMGCDIRDQLVEFRAQLGYVPEEPYLYPYLSGREYLQLVGRLRGMRPGVLAKKIAGFLDLFHLTSDGDTAMSSYSKGMRQKILISAALMHDPALVIFDEPMSGLDAASSLVFRHLVQSLARAGKTVLYSSHELETIEKVATRVMVLYAGRIVAHDSVERLRDLAQVDTLEEVFAQLVMREEPAEVADRIVDVMVTAG
jgi:ABC-2 type transport system ATP-binding protein